MSDYKIAATNLPRLEGQNFSLEDVVSGSSVSVTIPPFRGSKWPRAGIEAYGVAAVCHHPTKGEIQSFLKIFKQAIPERVSRTDFLIRFGLAKHHEWLFKGTPYGAIPRTTINGVDIVGHLAQEIPGTASVNSEDIFRIRENDEWLFGEVDRRRFSAHLCCAVYTLEALGVVHGDISPKNVIIGARPDGERAAMLCDFDGFYHPSVPMLPNEFDREKCRPRGTPGFQHPSLLKRLDDVSSYVASDRFALGAMICEIISWDQADSRTAIVDEQVLASRGVSCIPNNILARWPEGFELLDQALRAPSESDCPSPQTWLSALGFSLDNNLLPVEKGKFPGAPIIEILRSRGTNGAKPVKVVRLASLAGNFGTIDAALSQLRFTRGAETLTFAFEWRAPVFLRRGGKQLDLGVGPLCLEALPGDVVFSNQWEFRVATEISP